METTGGSASSSRNIRSVGRKLNRAIPFFVDLKGTKVRLGTFAKPVSLERGREYYLTPEKVVGDEKQAQVDSEAFLEERKINETDKIKPARRNRGGDQCPRSRIRRPLP